MSNSFLGENAAVPTESSGERPHRHAIERASRRWRGGRRIGQGFFDTSDKLGREKPNPNHVEEELCGRRVVPAFLGASADFFEKVLVSKWMRLVVVRLSARGTRRGNGGERA